MKRALLLLIPALIALSACSSCPTKADSDVDDKNWIQEVAAADIDLLVGRLQKEGLKTGWYKAGSVAWLMYGELPLKVGLNIERRLMSLRVFACFRHKAEIEPNVDLLLGVNNTNRDGYVKVYLDSEADICSESFYSYRRGIDVKAFKGFITHFQEATISAVKPFESYLM